MKADLRVALLLSVVLLLGAVFRALYLSERQNDAYFLSPGLDGAYHSYWAECIFRGDTPPPAGDTDPELSQRPYFRPPGYPFFLALVSFGGRSGPIVPRAAQMALGLASMVLLYFLGKRIFGASVGLIAAAMAALSWVLVYFEGELLEPPLLVALTLLLLNALAGWRERRRVSGALVSGILLGLCVLTRPNLLLFGAAVPFWMWWCARRSGLPARAAAAPVAAFLLSSVLAIAPATLRNYIVSREFVLVSANAGINLHFGNNEYSDGYTASSPEVGPWSCFDYPRIVRDLERREGRALGYSGASAHFARMAAAYAGRHPGRTAERIARKAALFWGPAEIGNNKEYHFDRLDSAVLRVLPVNFPSVLALALAGLFMYPRSVRSRTEDAGRNAESAALLILFVVTYFASYLPFIIAGRYRVPILPILFLFAAAAVRHFAALVRRKAHGEVAVWAVVTAAIFVAATINWGGYVPDRARWHYERGLARIRVGEISRGIADYDEALGIRNLRGQEPGNHPAMLDPRNVREEAADYYREAVETQPDAAVLHNNLGAFLFGQGRRQEAISSFRRALDLKPDYPAAKSNLDRASPRQVKLQGEPPQ